MSGYTFQHVLFLCVANSARSQMAEGWARKLFGKSIRVSSAGSEPSTVHPFALQVMQEVGIDLQGHRSKSVETVDVDSVDLVITLCKEEVCPTMLGGVQHLHWPLQDPARKNEEHTDAEHVQFFRRIRNQLEMRLRVLHALHTLPEGPQPEEFHASIRVPDLAQGARFYSWLLNEMPKEWTHRYVTFVSKKLRTNFVILVSDGKELHQDTLYHLGIDVGTKKAVIEAHKSAEKAGWSIYKPARTTWRGTPLHELWLKDPGGNLIEIYARLTTEQYTEMPEDKEPIFLIPNKDLNEK